MIARLETNIIVSLIWMLMTLSVVATFLPASAGARTLTWEEPTTKFHGVPVFWKFLDGYVAYYNLRNTPVSEIHLPDDIDLIIAYSSRYSAISAINTHHVPVIHRRHWFWFRPTLSWGYDLIFSYFSTSHHKIAVVYDMPTCNNTHWWILYCAPPKPATYYFKVFDWPGKENSIIKNIKIKYGAKILNEDTGEEIHNGESVPTGTRIRLSFNERSNADISWLGAKYWRPLLSYLRLRYGFAHWGFWIWNERAFWSLYPQTNTGIWTNSDTAPHAACRDQDLIFTRSVWRFNRHLLGNVLNYITLSAQKPAQTVDGIAGLSCTQDGGDYICTLSESGAKTFNFNFAPTTLRAYHSYKRPQYHWYGWWWRWQGFDQCLGVDTPAYKRTSQYSPDTNCTDNNRCWQTNRRNFYKYRFFYQSGLNSPTQASYFTPFTLSVPAQTISYTINVEDQNHSPLVPSVSGDTYVMHDNLATFNITSTDQDDDTLRFGIDWNMDNTIDQWLPESGYIVSGASATTTHSWSDVGVARAQVLAEDANGARSSWREWSTDVLGEPTLDFSADEYLIQKNDSAVLSWSAQNSSSCVAGTSWSGERATSGNERTGTLSEFQNEYTLTCGNQLASTTKTLSLYTYACGDGVCTTNVESCSTCAPDCGECGSVNNSQWDVFLNLTEDPPQVRYGGGDDEVGN